MARYINGTQRTMQDTFPNVIQTNLYNIIHAHKIQLYTHLVNHSLRPMIRTVTKHGPRT